MAGAGIRLFSTGAVLTAAQINQYLMDQSIHRFATTTARATAYSTAGVTLAEGMFSYIDSTNKLYYYSGSAWEEVGAQIEAGEVTDTEVSATAAIAISKLASGTAAQVILANATGVPTYTTLSGDVTVSNTGVTAIGASKVTSNMIVDGTIVNGDISASAAIALSKLATSTAGNIIVYNSSGVPTAVAETGDVLISDSGVTSIATGVIVNADIDASAAIDKTKISGTAITAADSGTVTSTMIADGTIVNADINASAAIAHSKLANATDGQVLLGTTTTGVVTATTVTGDVTITGAGVTAIGSGVVVNADISTTAAIALGKLADATIDIKTGNYTLQLTDKNKFIKMNITSTANTVTIPLDSTVTFPEGAQIHIIQYGSGKTQVVGASGSVIIYSTPGSYLRAQYSSATLLKCAAANTWMLMGDLSAS